MGDLSFLEEWFLLPRKSAITKHLRMKPMQRNTELKNKCIHGEERGKGSGRVEGEHLNSGHIGSNDIVSACF